MAQTVLTDTSGIFALIDRRSSAHAAVTQVFADPAYHFVIPAPTLPEVCYLIRSRLGHNSMQRFLAGLVADRPPIEGLIEADYREMVKVLTTNADLRLDFVDAAIVALAARLQIKHFLTLDHCDFRVIKPPHTEFFHLLP